MNNTSFIITLFPKNVGKLKHLIEHQLFKNPPKYKIKYIVQVG